MKKIIKITLIIVVIGAFVWTLFFLYKKSSNKQVLSETTSPLYTNIIKKSIATGSINPRKEIEIKPQVSGIIEKIYVIAGTPIKKGDIIAKVKIIPDMVNLNNAESRLKKAKLSLDDAKINYEKQKILFDKGIISETDFLQYQLSFNQSKEEYSSAEDNLQLIREGVTKKSGEVTNTLIRSTIEGMLLDVPVKEGNSVIESNNFNAGTTIATVADMGEMIFEGKIDESEVGKIKQGMPLLIMIGAIEEKTFDATLEYISPKGISENGAIQFQIKAAMKLEDGYFIRAGYSANATIILDKRDSVMSIPESVLQFENEKPYVEVESKPNIFIKKYIKTGLSDGLNIEVISGVSIKDKIKMPYAFK